ncbi:MAG: HAD-IIB family hydrolase [Phycisphaeraceae bacterium]
MTDTTPWLLVSDIDDTFLGDDRATDRLIRLASENKVPIALNSSRPWASVRQTLEGRGPWRPTATITAMGTQVRVRDQEDPDWARRFGSWSREPFDKLASEQGWTSHDPIMQTLHKASFAIPEHADHERVQQVIRGIGPAMVVISGHCDLDILPPDAGKGTATLHLASQLGVPLDRIVVAGDSANDCAMFDIALKGVVVGNAREELRQHVEPARVHIAQENFAAGIIEGLIAYGALRA